MKRYGNLFEKIVDLENIKLAHKNARKGKSKYREVIQVDNDIEYYCKQIQDMLMNRTFTSSEYVMFIKRDKGKDREVYKLPYFPDRIIQHAILQVVEPIWKATLINDTYQSIKGRGVHKCMHKVKQAVKRDKLKYCLQMDVKKFYPSVDNDILKTVIRRKIKCKGTLWVLDTIIDGHKGIPIGNYISQYFGNIYLSSVDHYIKEVLRVKHYFRYCDDIFVVNNDKYFLHGVRKHTEKMLQYLRLELKGNWQVYRISSDRKVDCLGFLINNDETTVRSSIIGTLRRAVQQAQLSGLYGWFKYTDQVSLYTKYYNRSKR